MLPTIAQALTTVDEMHREGLAADIHQGLLVLQGNIADNWRCQLHLASALPHLPNLLSPDVLAEHWAPYAFTLLLNGEGIAVILTLCDCAACCGSSGPVRCWVLWACVRSAGKGHHQVID